MNYQDLTNEELDKLAAEMLGYAYGKNASGENCLWNQTMHGDVHFLSNWNPTHPDSNQCRQYLVPKIIEKDFLSIMASEIVIDMGEGGSGCYVTAGCILEATNRELVIGALKTWDIIHGDQPWNTRTPQKED